MPRTTVPLRLVLLVASLCAMAPSAQADFVTLYENGYGPFACERDGGGQIPTWGYAESFSGASQTGTCERWRGDFDTGSGHVGRPMTSDIIIRSLRLSPEYTSDYSCDQLVLTNAPVPCNRYVSGAFNSNPYFLARAEVPGYGAECPLTSGMTEVCACTGAATPYDGSGYATWVVSDGHVAPGLPRGNPLKLVEPGAVGVGVECRANLGNYGLSWSPPAGYLFGQVGIAVYSCAGCN